MVEDVNRNVRSYDHFCFVARTLERVGERWSLLLVRDLLSGPKRFTDLMDRLGGITPKTLSQRLSELTDAGIVIADRQPGRREVWYSLTPAGAELGPIVDALGEWGLRHAWRLPEPGERLHVEHLLRAMVNAMKSADDDHEPVRWHLRFPGDEYVVENDGHRWSLAANGTAEQPDVTVVATPQSFAQFAVDPAGHRASELGIELVGDDEQTSRFLRLLGAFADAAN